MEQTIVTLENLSGEFSLLDELRTRGIPVSAPCGGRGSCGRCMVLANGKLVQACRTYLSGTVRVELAQEWKKPEGVYDLAVDLGTTNVEAEILSCADGKPVAVYSFPNAQRGYGADVINRTEQFRMGNGETLTSLIRNQIDGICDIRKISIAGNTVMECIYAGIDPTPIAVPPFTAPDLFPEDIVLMPCVSGYIGGDVTAGLAAAGAGDWEGLHLYIDFGTNGELALGNRDGFLTCACAAGPAFECCGTLYGSEVVDEIARLLREGAIGKSGRLKEPGKFTQQEIRSLQLAKSAIRSGIEVLLKKAGKAPEEVTDLVLAGKFGDYINPEHARSIGMLPQLPNAVLTRAGNAALKGAKLGLSEEGRAGIREIAKKCRYEELSLSEEFSSLFVKNLNF